MEVTFAWFWAINLSLIIAIVYSLFKLIKSIINEKNIKRWFIINAILIILQVINPIKINGTNSNVINNSTNYNIKQSKVLPPVKVDNSFKEEVNSVHGISKKDLK